MTLGTRTIRTSVASTSTAVAMPSPNMRNGRMSLSANDASAVTSVTAKRRILIHLNNTNPLLVDDGPERADVRARGWEVAHDGMELRL